MLRRKTRLLLLVLCWFAVRVAAHAQAPEDLTAPSPDQANEAKRLYAEGKVEFAQGRLAAAIGLFERSYALSNAPGLLFNLAQAHRLSGAEHCPQAFALYKSYLSALPEAENRREVEERIQELSSCANPPPELPAPVAVEQGPPLKPAVEPAHAPSPPPRRDTPGRPRLAPILLASVGAALMIAGGVLLARVKAKYAGAERECPCYPGTFQKWEHLTVLSYALIGVGAATAASGVSWWAFAAPGPGGARAALGVALRF
jgi:hypothetical protein